MNISALLLGEVEARQDGLGSNGGWGHGGGEEGDEGDGGVVHGDEVEGRRERRLFQKACGFDGFRNCESIGFEWRNGDLSEASTPADCILTIDCSSSQLQLGLSWLVAH